MIDAQTVQTLATKLDTGVVTLADAKAWVKRVYGVVIIARTKDQFIRKAAALARAQGDSK